MLRGQFQFRDAYDARQGGVTLHAVSVDQYADNHSSHSQGQASVATHEGDAMPVARGPFARKFRGSDRKMFRNVDVAAMCQKALGAAYGEEKSVHKTIAEDTGMSPSAAENWTAGENPMSLTAFLNAYHNNAAFKAWARKLLLMEAEIDPEFEAEKHRFMAACARQLGRAEP